MAITEPKVTLVAPVKLVPVKVTVVPIVPLVGLKPVMVGGLRMVKFVKLVALKEPLLTEIGPVVAPTGTDTVIVFASITLKVALTPLNLTVVIPVKLLPEMVTKEPTAPEVGVKLIICG